jgi:hypothetical protein
MTFLHMLILVNTSDHLEKQTLSIGFFSIQTDHVIFLDHLVDSNHYTIILLNTAKAKLKLSNFIFTRKIFFFHTRFLLFVAKRGVRRTSFWFGKRYSGTLNSTPFISAPFFRSKKTSRIITQQILKFFFTIIWWNISIRYIINQT